MARATASGSTVRAFGARVGAAVERFPAAILFVLLFTLAANRLVALSDPSGPDWRLLFSLIGAAAAATAAHLALEVRHRDELLRFAVPTFAGLVVGALVQRSAVPFVEVPLILLCAILAVPLVPFLGRERDGNAYWLFFLWGSAGAVLAFVAVLVSISGLTTALELFRLFFGIGLSYGAYSHIYATGLGLVGPLFALASLPATGPAAPAFSQDDRLIRLVRPLAVWIAPVLLLLQGTILHLYAPIAFLGGDGRLDAAILSTSFLFAVVSLRTALHPFRDDAAPLARLFVRVWLWLLAVPLLLILAALMPSVAAEGIEETAYALGAAAVVGVLIVLLQTNRRTAGDVVAINALVLAAMLVAAAGPLSLANVVSRSQAALIESRYGDAIRLGETLDEEDRRALRRSITRLVELDQLWRVTGIVGEEMLRRAAVHEAGSSTLVVDRLLALLGLPDERNEPSEDREPTRTLDGSGPGVFATGGFDTVASGLTFWPSRTSWDGASELQVVVEGTVLVIRSGTDEDRVDLSLLVGALPPELFETFQVEPPVVELRTAGGRTVGVRPVYLTLDSDDRPIGGNLTLLLRAREWASLRGDADGPAPVEPDGAVR